MGRDLKPKTSSKSSEINYVKKKKSLNLKQFYWLTRRYFTIKLMTK